MMLTGIAYICLPQFPTRPVRLVTTYRYVTLFLISLLKYTLLLNLSLSGASLNSTLLTANLARRLYLFMYNKDPTIKDCNAFLFLFQLASQGIFASF